MKRVIKSNEAVMAEGTSADDRYNEGLDNLQDDFNYLVESLDKMVRDGNMASAMELITSVQGYINESISNATGMIE